MSPCLIGLR